VAVLGYETCRGLCADARDARETVGGIADKREVVRDVRRCNTELCAYPHIIANLAAPAIDLHHPVPFDALCEVLVGRPDTHLLHARVPRRAIRGRRERVIGLELDHRPGRHAHGDERVFERMKLRP
jgi:hypothetical protein